MEHAGSNPVQGSLVFFTVRGQSLIKFFRFDSHVSSNKQLFQCGLRGMYAYHDAPSADIMCMSPALDVHGMYMYILPSCFFLGISRMTVTDHVEPKTCTCTTTVSCVFSRM